VLSIPEQHRTKTEAADEMVPTTARQLLDRGVWREPYTMAGYDVLIAVDRRGDVVKRVQLREGVNEERAVAWLEELLERVDPMPVLRLVDPSPAPRRLHPAREVDPRLYADPRTPQGKRRYIQQLTRAAVRALPPPFTDR
jgi:hypothetical protein